MPAWQAAGGMNAVISEGFDRAQIQALMDLQGTPTAERPDLTERLLSLESDFAAIRAKQRERDEAKRASESATKAARSNRSPR
jgi:hypothetical protein